MKKILIFLSVVFFSCTNKSISTVSIGKIGSDEKAQVWMTKNLDVTTYSDGTEIPQVTDISEWSNLKTGAWCYYNNDPAIGAIYGKLYNWYAIMGIYDNESASNPALRKKLAPIGWHIPSGEEWSRLIDNLGGMNIAAGKMKSTGTSLWQSPNSDATNESGFAALPGGIRSCDGEFKHIGVWGFWWSSSSHLDHNYGDIETVNLFIDFAGALNLERNERCIALSVRCIKD